MAPRVGPTESERHQIIEQLRAGSRFEDVKRAWGRVVEGEWFDANEAHLAEVLERGDVPKPSPVALAPPPAESQPADPEKPKAKR